MSTPLTWQQWEVLTDLRDDNVLTAPEHPAAGDPWQDMDENAYFLEPLLDLWERRPGGELNC